MSQSYRRSEPMSLFSFIPKPPAPPAPAIMTPCIGVCELDPVGNCEGCLRSGNEIAGWSSMTDEQRTWYMDEELPRREAKLG